MNRREHLCRGLYNLLHLTIITVNKNLRSTASQEIVKVVSDDSVQLTPVGLFSLIDSFFCSSLIDSIQIEYDAMIVSIERV